ncbi:hypothetical protein OIV83_000190 [Microbotryomycetes sp. JL201]|nr:hypothetical protein OIV83_000190 [Microbotryomycetes sp. JL201]
MALTETRTHPSSARAPAAAVYHTAPMSEGSSSVNPGATSSDGPMAPSSTPPTSPRLPESSNNVVQSEHARPLVSTSLRLAPAGAPKAESRDLRSFFTTVSPPRRKRVRSESPFNDGNTRPRGQASSSSATAGPSRPASSTFVLARSLKARKARPAKLEQMYLDPFETGGHSTLSCDVCSLAYSRTPEDMAFHDKHHKRVVSGCDWISADLEKKLGHKIQTVEQDVDCGNGLRGRVLMVDGRPGGALERRVSDVLSTVDAQLSSSSLTFEQLADCKIIVLLTSQRKIVACAVIQRISEAFQIGSSKQNHDQNSMLRFGEDEGAIFCSPTRVPVVLGVQRIWTSSKFRRRGLAARLLDAAAARCIYGYPIPQERRAADMAFSQPTGKGQALARAWTGTSEFRVFVD